MGRINWGSVIVDLAIIAMAVYVSMWQNNPNYLWLLALMFASGGYEIKFKEKKKNDEDLIPKQTVVYR